jgi:hypothetical protein
MKRLIKQSQWGFLVLLLILGACNSAESPPEQPATPSLEGTIQARVEQTISAIVDVVTSEPSPTPSASPTTTPTTTPTPEPVYVSVSAPTNCRIGPGVRYQRTGTLLIEATAEVAAKSSTPNFWYISNPDRPGEYCWLWGEYASVMGDVEVLPVFTPPPSPTPSPAFNMSLESFHSCGETDYVVFKIHNPTQITYMTAQRHLVDTETGKDLYGPALDRHPFAPFPRDCPPGHENEIYPDRVAYIYVPIRGAESGHGMRAIIMVCTEDYLGGDCWVQALDFTMPR